MKDFPIYFIPGWGFKAKIFSHLKLRDHISSYLDYFHIVDPSIKSISKYLSRSIKDNSCLVGWSLGGLFAIKIAYLYPHKVRKLILISSQPKLLAGYLWDGIDLEHFKKFKTQYKKDFFKSCEIFRGLVNYPNYKKYHKDTLLKNQIFSNQHNLQQLLELMFKTDLRDNFQDIKNKILIIYGESDSIIRQNGKSINSINSSAKIIIVNKAGHAGFLSHMSEYRNIIEEFISE